jgi:hypothetical protein
MLNDSPFYYKMMRKYVILMGNLFNNLSIVRLNSNNTERERIKVPIVFGPKERWVTRLASDPDLYRDFQITLPRMSFDITGYEYDSARKQNQLLRMAKGDNASRVASGFMGVPYDINFELSIYARNIDDGAQIVEQILPYFNPDYTVTINPIAELGFLKDIPVILTGVNQNIEYIGGFDDVRYVNWTLGFVLKGYFFGPISKPKIIRKSIANIFNDPSLVAGNIVRMNMNNINGGNYKIGDIVYQGDTYQTATAYGFVNEWSGETKKLQVGGAQGQFKLTNTIRGLSTNAAYTLESFDVTPLKLVKITVEPDPIDAEPEDDFGFSTRIEEFPNIVE